MKRLFFFLACFAAIIWLAGFLLQILRWPEIAQVLLYSGSTSLVYVLLPILMRIKKEEGELRAPRLLWQWRLGILALMMFVLSTWFKVWHLMGANELLVLSWGMLTFGFFPILFFNQYKFSLERL